MTVQVLTVDDQLIFREAARALIASTPGFALAGEASSGAEALSAADRLHPDLVLLDIRLPGLDGIETARILTAKCSDTVVVLVSGHDVDDVTSLADQCGAVALVAKERLRPALLRELWAAYSPRKAASRPES
jgi:DNA-binding NarL/FixJ family response regulator